MPYIGRSSNFGVRTRFLYTATASQTTFSGTDTQNLTLSYSDSNFIDVHQNGVLLKVVDDYTATSGTSVVLATGATASDVIEITVYDVFSIANHIKKTGDAMAGALTNIDIDGTELVLDADGDTSITADTDDQIDIKIAGSDSIRIKANEIENVSGDLTIDVAGDIILDADGADVSFRDGGVGHLQISNSSNDAVLTSLQTDKDMIFKGVDGGSLITALTLDMSDAGTAVFNHDITLDGKITGANQVTQDVNTSSLSVAGGTDSNVGANMTVYGGSHSSLAGVVRFRNGSTETARILSGGGITFNGDTATANALDDYEEGTHNPTSGSGVSTSASLGSYIKVGNVCVFYFRIVFGSESSSSNAYIVLPFTSKSESLNAHLASGVPFYTTYTASQIRYGVLQNTTQLYFYDGQTSQISFADLSGKQVNGSIVYLTA